MIEQTIRKFYLREYPSRRPLGTVMMIAQKGMVDTGTVSVGCSMWNPADRWDGAAGTIMATSRTLFDPLTIPFAVARSMSQAACCLMLEALIEGTGSPTRYPHHRNGLVMHRLLDLMTRDPRARRRPHEILPPPVDVVLTPPHVSEVAEVADDVI